jgi:gluconate 2-dehydrogenase gamma chain
LHTGEREFFTNSELRTLSALCDLIVPGDEAASGSAAGCVNYISEQIVRHFKPHQQVYRDGLRTLDSLAGGDFAAAPTSQREAAFRKMEKDPKLRPFVDLAIAHSLQGYYSSPRHGGNRDYASWRMLNLPVSPVRGRQHYSFNESKGTRS